MILHIYTENFIPQVDMNGITKFLIEWKEKLSRFIEHAELGENDYDISSSRYIHTSGAETYRPLAEIVEELDVIEAEAKAADKALRRILEKIEV
ncbi:MAG: hypothetical protein OXD47_07980 [Gammaproteobacteria bacterium]|nr:hypothetical protein [Gammaproteobacteria bacterium]